MEFHISRAVREATQVDDILFSTTGNVVFANVAASRKLAEALNRTRKDGRAARTPIRPAQSTPARSSPWA